MVVVMRASAVASAILFPTFSAFLRVLVPCAQSSVPDGVRRQVQRIKFVVHKVLRLRGCALYVLLGVPRMRILVAVSTQIAATVMTIPNNSPVMNVFINNYRTCTLTPRSRMSNGRISKSRKESLFRISNSILPLNILCGSTP